MDPVYHITLSHAPPPLGRGSSVRGNVRLYREGLKAGLLKCTTSHSDFGRVRAISPTAEVPTPDQLNALNDENELEKPAS